MGANVVNGIGWVVGPGSHRGRVQQERRDRVPELQVQLHDLDARPRAQVPRGAQGGAEWQRGGALALGIEWTGIFISRLSLTCLMLESSAKGSLVFNFYCSRLWQPKYNQHAYN